MPCYYPIDGWRSKHSNGNGKTSIVFEKAAAQLDQPVTVPCGRCIGCRLERSKEWGLRAVLESTQHTYNSFLTLTYNEEHLPEDQSIQLRETQLFMKKYRDKISPTKIRFLACGEYGENRDLTTTELLGRPHYHLLIFGHEFDDLVLHSTNKGNKLYTSETLTKLWGKGHAIIGDLTQDSAQYVARYSMKKIGGDMAEDHYKKTNLQTGEIHSVNPEFMTCSTRPGIAHDWFLKYGDDFKKGFIVYKGVTYKTPAYFNKLFEKYDEEHYLDIKENQRTHYDFNDPESKLDRLRVKEKIKIKRTKTLKRDL